MPDKRNKQVVHCHAPFGDVGTGAYSKAVSTEQEANDHCWIYAEAAMNELPSCKGNVNEPFVIAHYGCADGGVALSLTCKIVRKVREKFGKEKPVVVYYEDQATNNFSSVFKIATGQLELNADGRESYFATEENVFIAACGVSFYLQCFPPSTVDLAFSATAFVWGKSPPDPSESSFGLFGNFKVENIPSRVQHAKEDWEIILHHRAVEMKPGASFIAAELGRLKDGSRSGSKYTTSQGQLDVMHDCWTFLKDTAVITQEEFEKPVFATYFRSEAEHKAPFMDPNSAVMKAGLRLVHMEPKVWRCHHHKHLLATPDQDSQGYAERLAAQHRAWSNFTYLSALSDDRTPEEKNSITDKLFQRYIEIVASNPTEHCDDMVYRYVVMKKEFNI